MKIFSFLFTAIFAFIFSYFLSGCSNSYDIAKPITQTSAYPKAIERATKDKRYFIMHSGTNVYKIILMEMEKSKQQFTVHLNKVDSMHLANMNNPGYMREKLIHLYMRDSTTYTLDEPHTIPLAKVARIELVE